MNNNVNHHKPTSGLTYSTPKSMPHGITQEVFGRNVFVPKIFHEMPAGTVCADVEKLHDKNQNYLLLDCSDNATFFDDMKVIFSRTIKEIGLEVHQSFTSEENKKVKKMLSIYSIFKGLHGYVMNEAALSDTKIEVLTKQSIIIKKFLYCYTSLYGFNEEVDSLLLRLIEIPYFDKNIDEFSICFFRYTLYDGHVDFKRYDYIVNGLRGIKSPIFHWYKLLADANIADCGGQGLSKFTPIAGVDCLRNLRVKGWDAICTDLNYMDINLKYWGCFGDLIIHKKDFEKVLKLTSELILTMPFRLDDIDAYLEKMAFSEKPYELASACKMLDFLSDSKKGFECLSQMRVVLLNDYETGVTINHFKPCVAKCGGESALLDSNGGDWVARNSPFLRYSFIKKFNEWTVFMTQSPNCDSAEASKNLEKLNGYIASTKPKLDGGFHNVPDFIFKSMYSEFWVLAGIQSIISQGEDCLNKALHCAHAVAREDREMSVVLKTMFHLCEKDTKSALDVLNKGLQSLQESARLNYFKAELLALNPPKLKKVNWEKQIIHAYTVAGEQGIIKSFHKLSEFLMKNNSNSPAAWESASKSFASAVAALDDKNGDFYKHCFVMHELCQTIADKMNDAVPKKPSSTSAKATTESEAPTSSTTFSVDHQIDSAASALTATELTSPQPATVTQDEVKRKSKKSVQERKLQLERKAQYDEAIDAITNIARLIKLVRKGVNSHEDMKTAFEIAEKLNLKSSMKPSICALGHQQKAWCYFTILKHWVSGDTTKRAPNTKASRRKNLNARPKPGTDFPSQQELIKKMNAEIQKGLSVFEINVRDLEQYNWETLISCGTDHNEKKQIHSLIHTLGHLNSYLNTQKHQTLYNLSHSLKYHVKKQYSVDNCSEAFDL